MEKTNHSSEQVSAPSGILQQSEEAKPRSSFGERAFNWLVYGLWNHGVNLVLSAAIAFGFAGSKLHNSIISRLTGHGMSKSTAELATGITVLSAGGHVTALGVKPLEDHKKSYVRTLNERFSPKEADAELADNRKQTWSSVIGARLFTLGLAVVSLTGLKSMLGNNAQGIPRIDAFEDKMGKWFAKTIKPNAPVEGSSRLKLGKILALEVIIVTVMSTLFYFSSKLFSKKPPELITIKPRPDTREEKSAGAVVDKAAATKDVENKSDPKEPVVSVVASAENQTQRIAQMPMPQLTPSAAAI